MLNLCDVTYKILIVTKLYSLNHIALCYAYNKSQQHVTCLVPMIQYCILWGIKIATFNRQTLRDLPPLSSGPQTFVFSSVAY
jgi:hypothetical protein